MSYDIKYFAKRGGYIVAILVIIYFFPKLVAWLRNRKNKQNKKLKDSRDYQELENLSFGNQCSRKSGIPNYGNTCYLNSVLQVLASTPNFVDFISKSNTILFRNLLIIFYLMLSRISSSDFKPGIINFLNTLKEKFPTYELNAQNDCKELYNILIDIYIQEFSHEEKRFQITKNQTFTCQKGHKVIKSDKSLFFIIAPKDK
ncbi:unnamed protein product [Blepharisma stoltei]|uniref:ubiquitinyl hydrolase 1 n=1 Tax=Blepharisma stoltei TaxID=1481888 RepID=A0AAU9IQ55_9CILI|nr:unnamed protein product [Blepharisma stoltei]